MHSDMDHTVLPANYTMPCLYSPSAAAEHQPFFGWYSFYRPTEGWVDLGGWSLLHTETKCRSGPRLRESNPDTVTHPSTNRAQRRLTSLIETNDATTTRNRHSEVRTSSSCVRCWRCEHRLHNGTQPRQRWWWRWRRLQCACPLSRPVTWLAMMTSCRRERRFV